MCQQVQVRRFRIIAPKPDFVVLEYLLKTQTPKSEDAYSVGQLWGPESLLFTSFPGDWMTGPWANVWETLILRTLLSGNRNR